MSQPKEQADFATIRANVTMQMLLDHYSITLKKQGKELRGPCPIPGCGAGERSFQVNLTKNVFYCFHCQVGGNVIDFVAKMERCNVREAGLKIQQWFDLAGQTSPPPAQDLPSGPANHQPAPLPEDIPALEHQLSKLYIEKLQIENKLYEVASTLHRLRRQRTGLYDPVEDEL